MHICLDNHDDDSSRVGNEFVRSALIVISIESRL